MAVVPELLIQGPAEVWHGTFGATEPINAVVAPGVGWTNLGPTDGGVTGTLAQTYTGLTVDQVYMDVESRLTAQGATVATSLAEATLANLRRAVNLAEDVATKFEWGGELSSNTSPLYSAVMLRGPAPGTSKSRLVIVRRCLSTEGLGLAYTKDSKTVIPITWKGHFVSESVRAVVIDDTQAA